MIIVFYVYVLSSVSARFLIGTKLATTLSSLSYVHDTVYVCLYERVCRLSVTTGLISRVYFMLPSLSSSEVFAQSGRLKLV